ncbi:MAG: hypothetical protein JWO39_553 [Gemmatimonadetes bacterium]|nr:hypothetical protein [Gemmatimonadota bacterium]
MASDAAETGPPDMQRAPRHALRTGPPFYFSHRRFRCVECFRSSPRPCSPQAATTPTVTDRRVRRTATPLRMRVPRPRPRARLALERQLEPAPPPAPRIRHPRRLRRRIRRGIVEHWNGSSPRGIRRAGSFSFAHIRAAAIFDVWRFPHHRLIVKRGSQREVARGKNTPRDRRACRSAELLGMPSRIRSEAQAELRSEPGDVPHCQYDGGGFRVASVWATADPYERRANESTAHSARAMTNRVSPSQ